MESQRGRRGILNGYDALGAGGSCLHDERMLPQGFADLLQILTVQQAGIPRRVYQQHFRRQGLPQFQRAIFFQPAGEVEHALALHPVAGGVLHHHGDGGIGIVLGNHRVFRVIGTHLRVILGFCHQRPGLGQAIGERNGE